MQTKTLRQALADQESAQEAQRQELKARLAGGSEEELLAADVARNVGKGERLAARNDERAMALQLNGSGVR